MRWNNLRENKCPKCGADLEWRDANYNKVFVCVDPKCDFYINDNKFEKIVMDMNNKALAT
jgi:ssDNA-binding Zn-finger/Zn-ribbon topoisomerase 1